MKNLFYILLIFLISFSGCRAKRAAYISPEIKYDTTSHGHFQGGESYYELETVPDYLLEDTQEPEEIVGSSLEISDDGMNDDLIMESVSPVYDEGTLVYKVDSVLIIGVVSRVEARIIKQVNEETTEHLVSLTSKTTTGVIYEEIIKVGNIMDMELKSLDLDAFTINKITDDEQLVDEVDVTYWLWSVTANKTGSYNLIMTAKIKENGPSRDIIIFDKSINVVNKPKKKYNVEFDIPDKLKRYSENIIKIKIKEKDSDTYMFDWGGEGEVVLNFDGNVDISINDNIINDNKSEFNYKWIVKPEGKEKTLPFKFMIKGDYEDYIFMESEIEVDKNFKESFNRFIDGAIKRWYWIFTALLIPIFSYIRKKYIKKKD